MAYRFAGAADAEDLLQDTFLAAWRSLPSLRDATKAAGWLYAILRHTQYRRLRAKVRSREIVLPADARMSDFADPGPDVLTRLADHNLLEWALEALPTAQREALVLRYVEGLDSYESAARIGVSRGTVLSRVHRARRTLRVLLRSDLEDTR